MTTELEIIDLTEIVGEFEVSCDYADGPDCRGESPKWVLFFRCCEEGSGIRLACDPCKDVRLLDQISIECQACGYIFEHAPEAYVYIEPLERK